MKKITFRSLSGGVQQALRILSKTPEIALTAVLDGVSGVCVIGKTRGIDVSGDWKWLSPVDREILVVAGWTRESYNGFRHWYTFWYPMRKQYVKIYLKRAVWRRRRHSREAKAYHARIYEQIVSS